MNKQLSLVLHSILISSALLSLLPTELAVRAVPAMTQQSARTLHPDALLISFGRGMPGSRAGGGTR